MRQSIRDRRSSGPVQTRVMDFIINEDGSEILETKDGNVLKTILYADLVEQVAEARRRKSKQKD